MHQPPHISVCICTFKRPALLTRLLTKLINQSTEGLFTYSIVVVDNDRLRSAQEIVDAFCIQAPIATYCVEPEPNIALARNQAIKHARGGLIAFIDDDEFPEDRWLCTLFKAMKLHKVNGTLGPVKPHFDFDPPQWVKKGKFFERPIYATGYRLAWHESRTGNVLFQRSVLTGVDIPFQPQFGAAGEDIDFFRRMTEKGFTFAWCNEAAVYESIPPSRCTRGYLLKRALLRGSNSGKDPRGRLKKIIMSLVAIPSYLLVLPFLAVIGQHLFLKFLIKLFDHGSRLLSFMGLQLVIQRET